jgi:hypothetical protein
MGGSHSSGYPEKETRGGILASLPGRVFGLFYAQRGETVCKERGACQGCPACIGFTFSCPDCSGGKSPVVLVCGLCSGEVKQAPEDRLHWWCYSCGKVGHRDSMYRYERPLVYGGDRPEQPAALCHRCFGVSNKQSAACPKCWGSHIRSCGLCDGSGRYQDQTCERCHGHKKEPCLCWRNDSNLDPDAPDTPGGGGVG